MKPIPTPKRSAGTGAVVARAAVVLGLAAAVGLLTQGDDGGSSEDIAAGSACVRGVFSAGAAL